MTATTSNRCLTRVAATLTPPSDQFELDEAEVWNASYVVVLPEPKKQSHDQGKLMRLKSTATFARLQESPPVNIPDWSKILGDEYRPVCGDWLDDKYDYEEGNDRIPPHEYLMRTRGVSFSVHEGVGRTLKGRDLSRVRNAIWKQIGFED